MVDIETKVHTSERLTLLPRQIPPRPGEGRSKALVCLTLTMIERKHRASHGGQKGAHGASHGGDGDDCGERNGKEG